MATYASQVNAKYNNTNSHFVDLKDRWNQTMGLYPLNTRRRRARAQRLRLAPSTASKGAKRR